MQHKCKLLKYEHLNRNTNCSPCLRYKHVVGDSILYGPDPMYSDGHKLPLLAPYYSLPKTVQFPC
jgi:hypothetical protein